MGLGGGRDILQRREAGQDLGDLEGACEAAQRPLVDGQAGDVLAAEGDGAGIQRHLAGDLADQRRLAGAVRADDGVELAGPDVSRLTPSVTLRGAP